MEEIKHKLLQGDLCQTENAADKILQRITTREDHKEEIEFIWEQCRAGLNKNSVQSCAAIIEKLVKMGKLESAPTLSAFLSIAPTSKAPNAIIQAIAKITEDKKFAISSNPHPFINLLRSFPSSWPQIHAQLNSSSNFDPVYLFAFCDPNSHSHLAPFRSACLDQLTQKSILKSILIWMNYKGEEELYENFCLALRIIKFLDYSTGSIPILCSLILKCCSIGIYAENAIQDAKKILQKKQYSNTDLELSLILIGKCIEKSSPNLFHNQLIQLASEIIQKEDFSISSSLVTASIATNFLPTISQKAKISTEKSTFMKLLLKNYSINQSEIELATNEFNDVDVGIASLELNLYRKLNSPEKELNWLESIEECKKFQLIQAPIFALAMRTKDSRVLNKSIEILAHSNSKNKLSALIMHKLSQTDLNEPEVSAKLLQKLPILGKNKTSIGFVLNLINSLSARSGLTGVKINLLFELWLIEDRIYPNLKRALEEKESESQRAFQILWAKAKVVREICRKESKKYGADLLPIISNWLNRSPDEKESGIAILALKAIQILCKECVIDLKTTLKVLRVKLQNDPREKVHIEFLKLKSLAPAFKLDNEDFIKFRREILAELWNQLQSESRLNVKNILFELIAKFKFEDHELKMLPDFCKLDLKYPSNFNPNEEEDLKPEQVWKFVPGDCWVKLIGDSPEKDLEGYFKIVSSLVDQEISDLPRGVFYRPPSMRTNEPSSFSYMPESSLLRGILGHIQDLNAGRGKSKKRTRNILKLLENRSKLPPLDVTVLSEHAEFELLCQISAQVYEDSWSARRIIDDELDKLKPKCVPCLMDNLIHFGKQINSDRLTQLITQALQSDDPEELKKYFTTIKECLKIEEIPSILAQIYSTECKRENFFDAFLDISHFLPQSILEDLCQDSIRLRSHLAASTEVFDNPLSWMNPCLEKDSIPDQFQVALKLNRLKVESFQANRRWLLELMGQIRSLSRQSLNYNQLFEVFIESVLIFSEIDRFQSDRFDESVRILLTWIWPQFGPQLCEWMLQMIKDEKLDSDKRKLLIGCFPAFKGVEKYSEATMWSRLVPIHSQSSF